MIDIITQLRHHLHNCAEISGKEEKTKALLMNFLKKYTTLELHPCGEGFYAAHREKNAVKPAIALRADYDALLPCLTVLQSISAVTMVMLLPFAARR